MKLHSIKKLLSISALALLLSLVCYTRCYAADFDDDAIDMSTEARNAALKAEGLTKAEKADITDQFNAFDADIRAGNITTDAAFNQRLHHILAKYDKTNSLVDTYNLKYDPKAVSQTAGTGFNSGLNLSGDSASDPATLNLEAQTSQPELSDGSTVIKPDDSAVQSGSDGVITKPSSLKQAPKKTPKKTSWHKRIWGHIKGFFSKLLPKSRSSIDDINDPYLNKDEKNWIKSQLKSYKYQKFKDSDISGRLEKAKSLSSLFKGDDSADVSLDEAQVTEMKDVYRVYPEPASTLHINNLKADESLTEAQVSAFEKAYKYLQLKQLEIYKRDLAAGKELNAEKLEILYSDVKTLYTETTKISEQDNSRTQRLNQQNLDTLEQHQNKIRTKVGDAANKVRRKVSRAVKQPKVKFKDTVETRQYNSSDDEYEDSDNTANADSPLVDKNL